MRTGTQRRRVGRLLVALVLASAITGPRAARAGDPLVFAASSLIDALTEIGKAWQREKGSHVDFAFGASSDLARQVEQGAPADVFFSADPAQMDRLEAAGLVAAADRRDLLSNSLVVVVPADSPLRIEAPGDLAGLDRVAIADPDAVPVGKYARAWLERAGAWEKVLPRVVRTLDARGTLAAVAEGHAAAGVVYRTDAATSGKVRVALEVSREQGPVIVYPVAPLRDARHAAARELAAFLASAEALRVYERHGFVVLKGR